MLPLRESGRQILASSIALIVLATIAVVLRFVSKFRSGQNFAPEDGLILAALVMFAAYNSVLLYCTYDSASTNIDLVLIA